jgi:hypothetical protein
MMPAQSMGGSAFFAVLGKIARKCRGLDIVTKLSYGPFSAPCGRTCARWWRIAHVPQTVLAFGLGLAMISPARSESFTGAGASFPASLYQAWAANMPQPAAIG